MWDSVLGFLVDIQSIIRESVASDVREFSQNPSNWPSLALVLPLGIAFGAVHALTPGHSKTVLASYLAGSSAKTLRGVGIASVLSFVHIGTSVLIAVLALPIVERSLVGAGRAPLLEDLSRGLIAIIGIWMIVRAVRAVPHRHSNGALFGLAAGLVPCPLTLFTMTFAMSRGVPEAGIAFAFAMMLGVATTLSTFALLTILIRDRFTRVMDKYGSRIAGTGRILEASAGVLLVGIGLGALVIR
ncbi:sulfite exporter TauE/SafE family protein [Filomicrobium sp.]|uniref:nickel/cobalt transporter n=1 Tax=Filomicrobium sp. TaxID=2024831 RepID=UPI00258D4A24|nr:sulfite exporter TauE/SafE family protein [Filomicrobium sp.]MCV0371780.1 sulfite exporter TauE/SafE family protein [Filomicrobium sp.]